jgi:hypothetical protein
MFLKTPGEFLAGFRQLPSVQDHHFTGPLPNQQPENNGSVFHEEGVILATLAYNLGGPVLETGADQGISTRYIHEGLEASGKPGKIYSVDVLHKWPGADWPGVDPDWPLRVKIDGDAGTYIPPEKCRWAFIDDNHQYRGVIRAIGSALRAGCTKLLFHDAADHIRKNPDNPSSGSDVRDAVPEFFAGLPGWHIFDISTHCGLFWVINVDK